MKNKCLLLIVAVLAGCQLQEEGPGLVIQSHSFNFSEDDHGFAAGFCDFLVEDFDSLAYSLTFDYTGVPAEIDHRSKALLLSANNANDDLFMYVKKKITHLQPHTLYTLTYEIEMVTNGSGRRASSDGISDSTFMFLKVGASSIEPKSVIIDGNYAMNIDKGHQQDSGENMVMIGKINTAGQNNFELVNRSNSPATGNHHTPLTVKTNANGEAWLIVGTESAFKGTNTVYYTSITAVFSRPD